jgi:hypothetical protein
MQRTSGCFHLAGVDLSSAGRTRTCYADEVEDIEVSSNKMRSRI